MKIDITLSRDSEAKLRKLSGERGESLRELAEAAITNWLTVVELTEQRPQADSSRKAASNGAVSDQTGKRPERMKLTAEESLRRTRDFKNRREQFIASIREGKNRDLHS